MSNAFNSAKVLLKQDEKLINKMIEVKIKEFEDEKYRRLSLESKYANSNHESLSNAMAERYEVDLQFAATKGFVCGLKLMEHLLYWLSMAGNDSEKLRDNVINVSIQREIDRYLDNGFDIRINKQC